MQSARSCRLRIGASPAIPTTPTTTTWSLTSLDDMLSDNAIEQYVSRLRRRLAPHGVMLRTARGIGYYIDKGPGA